MLDDQEAHLPRRSEPDLQLAQVIAQRAAEAMDAADHLFRVGRGRIADVAARYGMARQTASRILDGEATPSVETLVGLAHDCDVSADWLLGLDSRPLAQHRAARPSVVSMVSLDAADTGPGALQDLQQPGARPSTEPAVVEVPFMDVDAGEHTAAGAQLQIPIPRVLLPGMLAAARLVVVRWHLHSAYPLLQAGDHLLVRVSRRPRGDGLHWCVWGAAEPALLHLHHHPGSDSYTLIDPATGREETRPAGSLAFGLPDGDAGARHGAEYQPLRIVGPVVGRLTFWEDGTRLPPASRSSVSSLVGLG